LVRTNEPSNQNELKYEKNKYRKKKSYEIYYVNYFNFQVSL
jgi:hypothetical protein